MKNKIRTKEGLINEFVPRRRQDTKIDLLKIKFNKPYVNLCASLGQLQNIIDDPTFVIALNNNFKDWQETIEKMTRAIDEELFGRFDCVNDALHGESEPIFYMYGGLGDQQIQNKYHHLVRKGHRLSTKGYFTLVNGKREPCFIVKDPPLFYNNGNMYKRNGLEDKGCGNILLQKRVNELVKANEQLKQQLGEHKRAQKKLQERIYLMQDIMNSITYPIYYKDIQGTYLGVNTAFKTLTNLKNEDIIGKSVLNVFSKEFADECWKKDAALLADPGAQIYKTTISLDDNSVRDIIINKATYAYADGTLAGIVGVVTDVKVYKRAVEALRTSEERFSKAFKASPNPMYIATLEDGRFLIVNDSFLHYSGYRIEEIIGKTPTDLGSDLESDSVELIKRIDEQGGSIEFSYYTKTGQRRVGLYAMEIIDINGDQYLLGQINDITERKQLEKEIAHFDRLNLIAEMAAGIGHEIRNPITTVRGFLQLMGEKQECIDYRPYYELMIDELDRANSIITEFLSLSRKKSLVLKPQNLNLIIEAIAPLIKADAMRDDKYINLELGNIPDLLLNDKEIRQLIFNLVRNGLEAMSANKKLIIRTFMDSQNVVLLVEDEGAGIEPGLMKKISIPFFTTKDNGTGLGLSVCYSIAARHDAVIDVESSSSGTTFLVRFKPKL